ncbi:hypothetical protein FCV25MIE_02609 [Fagus crenata]
MIGRYKGRICPRIHKKLEIEKSNSRTWTPRWSGDDDLSVYEVSMYPHKYIVDISKNTCTCGSWALSGIPCVHACFALGSAGKNIEDFVHSCYNMTSFTLAYEPCVLPINGPDLWPQSNRDTILPPPYRKQLGRPKKRTRREHDEPRNTYRVPRIHAPRKCRKCGQVGHNKRSCTNDLTNETAPPSQIAAGPSLRRKIMYHSTFVVSNNQSKPHGLSWRPVLSKDFTLNAKKKTRIRVYMPTTKLTSNDGDTRIPIIFSAPVPDGSNSIGTLSSPIYTARSSHSKFLPSLSSLNIA